MTSTVPMCKSCKKTTCYPKPDGTYYDFCRAGCIPRDTKVVTNFKDILSRCAQCRINKREIGKPYCGVECANAAKTLAPPACHQRYRRIIKPLRLPTLCPESLPKIPDNKLLDD